MPDPLFITSDISDFIFWLIVVASLYVGAFWVVGKIRDRR
jgi:hypothetical protein